MIFPIYYCLQGSRILDLKKIIQIYEISMKKTPKLGTVINNLSLFCIEKFDVLVQ